ncbi:hypothetical protein Golax_017453, partial [Gossypium laxum]|nr:hypothetical protein [Gossypium laxum]
YWGYKVRYASNISSVFSDCPYKGGYDHLIGTSEHGIVVKSSQLNLPAFRHLLIAFGGLLGLEKSVEEDNKLKGKNVRDIFNMYLNTCPHQGSRTIRTEEALLISLQYFQEPITRAMQGPDISSRGRHGILRILKANSLKHAQAHVLKFMSAKMSMPIFVNM